MWHSPSFNFTPPLFISKMNDDLLLLFSHAITDIQIYKVILEIVFKLAPTVLIAGLNLQIMIVYRRVSKNYIKE